MDIIEEIKEICNKLEQIQNHIDMLGANLQTVDYKISDLLHCIENNKLSTKGCYRIVQEIRKCRLERRQIKNDMELAKTLRTNFNKLISPNNNRQFLLVELNKTNSRLNQPYKNRVYTEEEIKEVLGV